MSTPVSTRSWRARVSQLQVRAGSGVRDPGCRIRSTQCSPHENAKASILGTQSSGPPHSAVSACTGPGDPGLPVQPSLCAQGGLTKEPQAPARYPVRSSRLLTMALVVETRRGLQTDCSCPAAAAPSPGNRWAVPREVSRILARLGRPLQALATAEASS